MEEAKKQKFRYIKKEGAPNIGLGLLNNTQGKGAGLGKLGNQGAEGGIRAQIEPMVEGLGNRIESRFLRIRTRMQTLGIGNMQSQVKEEPKREPVFYCPECNMPVEKEMLFCPSCASPLNIEAKKLKDHKEKLRISANMAVLCDS